MLVIFQNKTDVTHQTQYIRIRVMVVRQRNGRIKLVRTLRPLGASKLIS